MPVTTRFYQTAIDHVYFYEIDFAKLIIRYLQYLWESTASFPSSVVFNARIYLHSIMQYKIENIILYLLHQNQSENME